MGQQQWPKGPSQVAAPVQEIKVKLPRNSEDRQKRLVGNLLDGFDHLRGQGWVTLIGVIILVVLVLMSFLPMPF